MRFLIITLGAIFVIMSQINAQDGERDRVASEAIETFKELITEENYERMGFGSLDEVDIATLGVPIQVFMVRLDHLKEYEPGTDPESLLSGGDEFNYPLLVNEEVRSSIIVMKRNDEWKAVSFGGPNLITLLTEIRRAKSEETQLPLSSFSAVRVPALNFYFLAHRVEEGLMFTPLLDDPDFGFGAGATMPADLVFETILPAAQEHDGLPR